MKKLLFGLAVSIGLFGSVASAQTISVTSLLKLVKGPSVIPVNSGWTLGSTTTNGAFNNITIKGTCTGSGCGGGGGASTTLLTDTNTFSGGLNKFGNASTTLFSNSSNFWLNTTGYPQGIIGAADASPNFNVEVNSQSQGPFTSIGMKNGGQAGGIVLDTTDTFNGKTNYLVLTNINSPMTCLGFSNQTLGCMYSDNTLDTLYDIYPPAGGKEATWTNSLPQPGGTVWFDNTEMNYGGSTGLNASFNDSKSNYLQPFPTRSWVWWDQGNGNQSNASSSYAWLAATTTEYAAGYVGPANAAPYGGETQIALGDVATSSYSSPNGVKLHGATLQLVATSSQYQAFGVYKGAIATTSQLFGVYNSGTSYISNSLGIATTSPMFSFTSAGATAFTGFNGTDFFTSLNGGNVGTGGVELLPSATGNQTLGSLQISGAGIINGPSSNTQYGITVGSGSNRTFDIGNTGSGNQVILFGGKAIGGTGNTFVGIGSSTPFSDFAIHAMNGDTNTTLFAIGSSTQSATTTLFSVDNQGNVTVSGPSTGSATKGVCHKEKNANANSFTYWYFPTAGAAPTYQTNDCGGQGTTTITYQ